ncbi:MAG: Gfo/Idh/MocA family oxidoreductase [Kosmotoga sp.]|uniref:Gfo/Idh/MocA family protein n=1 Tax=Kosmotoga sp. TaxID=1955248 RepID=UPI001DB7DC1B|nr:Gfo/Idh/MocA family oxidoreductase [Kosmotoga sp.]MBO8166541.1 Gfo/Idh/MocA family oxidoreductase [Kosmotoga sp.]
MEKLRLAIIGCGIAARELHLPALKRLRDRIEIVALASRTREKAEQLSLMIEPKPRVFDSADELMASGVAEAVDLALPTILNPDFIEKALKYNLHVIAEKPIAVDMKNAKKVLNLENNSDKTVYIAENYRHIPVFQKAARIINDGGIGKPAFLVWKSTKLMDKEDKYVQTSWRKKPLHIAGFISDAGVHHIAATRTMLGDIEEVSAYLKRVRNYLGAEDTITMNLLFENGAIGNYIASYGLEFGNEISIIGTEGNMYIEGNIIKIFTARDQKTVEVQDNDGFLEEFSGFYNVVKFGKENLLGSSAQALKDLMVIEAAVKSFKERKHVKITSILE